MRSIDSEKPDIGAVIVCAGRGMRTGLAYNKILYNIGQKTVLETVLDKFVCSRVNRLTIVISPADEDAVKELISSYPNVGICYGGDTRAKSVLNGLNALGACDIAVIHDGARPFVTTDIIDASIASALKYGSGVVAVPSVDTVKTVDGDKIVSSLPRERLYNMQTPQTFVFDDILKAYENCDEKVTDDSEAYMRAGFTAHIVKGSYDNIKITNASDLIPSFPRGARLGIGFDVHRLVAGRPLVIGGVVIPYDKGLDGHSDADVLTHAVMDALLSAAGLPDIGVLFPDTDDKYKGISSVLLLKDVAKRVKKAGFNIVSISAVVIAQSPKLSPHIASIRENLATDLDAELSAINVSATTTEHLGLIGSGDAMAASASCILSENDRGE